MRWLIFTIAAFVAYVLETGLRNLLAIPDEAGAAPSFLLILAAFIGLMAPSPTVAWAALVLGLLTDLKTPLTSDGVLIGPAAVGFLAGGYALVQLRAMVFRESVLSLAVMTFTMGVFAQLVIVAILTVRGLTPAGPIEGWDAPTQLLHRFFDLLYTVALSIPLGVLLFRYVQVWGFPKVPRTGY